MRAQHLAFSQREAYTEAYEFCNWRNTMFNLLSSLIMGALVGWIAGKIMDAQGGLLRSIVVGIIGSFVGSFVFGFQISDNKIICTTLQYRLN